MKAILALEDGTIFEGSSIGATGTATGEVCFNTAVSGYQELLTDPATHGLIPVMTYPLIGNYGVCEMDNESKRPHASALVVTELARLHSNWNSQEDMGSWMTRHGLVGIAGVDCRAIATHIRDNGTMRGCVTTELNEEDAVATAKAAPTLEGANLVHEITDSETCYGPWAGESREWKLPNKTAGDMTNYKELPPVTHRMAVFDFGVRYSTLAALRRQGIECVVISPYSCADDVYAGNKCDSVFLSDGPGDPAAVNESCVETIANLVERGCPVFGNGMGNLLLARAMGASTRKLKFGHHGANQPVKDERAGHVLITSQNDNFTVIPETLPAELEVVQINMNDNTVAALKHKSKPIFTVQYIPSEIPGPKGADSYFAEIAKMLKAVKA